MRAKRQLNVAPERERRVSRTVSRDHARRPIITNTASRRALDNGGPANEQAGAEVFG
jgi:hypothetical protein